MSGQPSSKSSLTTVLEIVRHFLANSVIAATGLSGWKVVLPADGDRFLPENGQTSSGGLFAPSIEGCTPPLVSRERF
jgi:hypothetical protein